MTAFNRYEHSDPFSKIGNKGKINYMGTWWPWMAVEYSFRLSWFCDMSGKPTPCESLTTDPALPLYSPIFLAFRYKKKVFLAKLCGSPHFFLLEYKANVSYFSSLLRALTFLEFLNMTCGTTRVDFNFCVTAEERSVCHIRNGTPPDVTIYGFDCGTDYIHRDLEENRHNHRMVIQSTNIRFWSSAIFDHRVLLVLTCDQAFQLWEK